LEDRIERLPKAIARYNYPGVYRGVFQSNATSSDTWLRIWCGLANPISLGWKLARTRIDDCFGYAERFNLQRLKTGNKKRRQC